MNPDTSKVDIRALAQLARVDISESEIGKLEQEIPKIIAFVEMIRKADVSGARADTTLRNVMRADAEPHASGIFSERLLEAAPSRKGDRIAVKQVISRRKN